jgi:hypothetical protein
MPTNPRPAIGAWLVLGGATATAVGCLLPWVVATIPFVETVRANGLDNGPRGWLLMACALVAALIGAWGTRFELRGPWPVLVLAAGVVAMVVSGVDAFVVLDGVAQLRSQGVTATRLGPGVLVANAGAVAVVAGATQLLLVRRRAVLDEAAAEDGYSRAA